MTHQFGTYSFDDTSLELTREGRRVRLEPQPAKALAALLAAGGQVVTREALRQVIWGDETHVDYDRGLTYCIGQVRAALADSGENPRFVETLPRRGFRFLAPVVSHGAGSPTATGAEPPIANAPATQAAAARRPWLMTGIVAALAAAFLGGLWFAGSQQRRVPTVAVSIFDNETGDTQFDGFVSGLADVVVTRLTALAPGRLGVIGNAAPLRQPRNIRNLATLARTLDADYVILGQLQRQDAGLRFIVHFIRLQDGVHLDADRLVRPDLAVDGLESEVVAAAERAVRDHVLTAAGPSPPTASR